MARKKNKKENQIAEKFFYTLRLNEGVRCNRCGSPQHSYVKTIKMFTCKKCKHRTSLKSGTIMHSSKLSLLTWYRAFELLRISKKGISAKEMQRHLKLKNYRPAFELMHKIRSLMCSIETDRICALQEEYVTVKTKMDLKDSSERKKLHNVLIINPKNKLGHYQISMVSYSEINKFVPTKNAKTGIYRSRFLDKKRIKLTNSIYLNDLEGWMQIHYLNFEKNITGIYHGISTKYRQNYMDEFCFKLNVSMAKQDLFDVLTKAAVRQTWWAFQNTHVQTNT
jgi:hypothetical protein